MNPGCWIFWEVGNIGPDLVGAINERYKFKILLIITDLHSGLCCDKPLTDVVNVSY